MDTGGGNLCTSRCLRPEAFIWTASAIRQMRWQVIRIQKKKLQILRDRHMGAFAAIWLGCYFIAQLALAVTAATNAGRSDGAGVWLLKSAEALPGLQLRAFSSCEKQWSGYTFAEYADKKKVRTFLVNLTAVPVSLLLYLLRKKRHWRGIARNRDFFVLSSG